MREMNTMDKEGSYHYPVGNRLVYLGWRNPILLAWDGRFAGQRRSTSPPRSRPNMEPSAVASPSARSRLSGRPRPYLGVLFHGHPVEVPTRAFTGPGRDNEPTT
jgi:hypothetical protein